MKYFEFTFDTHPCTETVNDVLAAVLGEAGFESFVAVSYTHLTLPTKLEV